MTWPRLWICEARVSKKVGAANKTAVGVAGTNTHSNVRSPFLTVYKFNYCGDHALPEHLQPLADTDEPSPEEAGSKMNGSLKAASQTRVL